MVRSLEGQQGVFLVSFFSPLKVQDCLCLMWILQNGVTIDHFHIKCSKWVMMNEDTRRLQKVNDDVRDEYLIFCPKTPRYEVLMFIIIIQLSNCYSTLFH